MYISKAQYCAPREIAEVVDFFPSIFFLSNNRKTQGIAIRNRFETTLSRMCT